MIRIITLMDNSPGRAGTTAEHGLCFLVERDGRSLLFDTGGSGAFLDNARGLGAEPGAAEALVVSHGHYDHGGGVRALLDRTAFRGPLYTGGGFFDKKWADEEPAPRYLGVDFDGDFLLSRRIEHRTVTASGGDTAFMEALPGVFVVNGFPRLHTRERPNPRFVVDRDGRRTMDDFRDEVCLAIEVPGGIAAVLGCAHPGIMNMLDAVRKAFGKTVVAVFGGSHLVDADAERISSTVDYLGATSCSLAALGHCTGDAGKASLAARLPAYRPLAVGAEYRL